MSERIAEIKRTTAETDISLKLNLDGAEIVLATEDLLIESAQTADVAEDPFRRGQIFLPSAVFVSEFLKGDGLAHEVIGAADYVVRIPMAHGVDSLNVAAAAAVAFWELR